MITTDRKTQNHAKVAVFLCGLLLVSLLGGCISIGGPQAAIPEVIIRERAPKAVCSSPLPLQLGVAFPISVNNLRTDRIALLFNDREIRYLSNAKWDTQTQMLFSRSLVNAFEASNCFRAVGTDFSGQATGIRLETSIDMFHLVYKDEASIPVATLDMRLTLIDTGSGEALGTTLIHTTSQAASKKTEDLLDAMDNVMNEAMDQTTKWVAQTITAKTALLKKYGRL